MIDVFRAYAREFAGCKSDFGGARAIFVYYEKHRSKKRSATHPSEPRELIRYLLEPSRMASDAKQKYPKIHHDIDCEGFGCLRFSRGCAAGDGLIFQAVANEVTKTHEVFYTHGLAPDFEDPLRLPAHVTLVHEMPDDGRMNAHYTFYESTEGGYRRRGDPKMYTDVFSLEALRASDRVLQEVRDRGDVGEFETLTSAVDAHMLGMTPVVPAVPSTSGGANGANGANGATELSDDDLEWLLDIADACLSHPDEDVRITVLASGANYMVIVDDRRVDKGLYCTRTHFSEGSAWMRDEMSTMRGQASASLDAIHRELTTLYLLREEEEEPDTGPYRAASPRPRAPAPPRAPARGRGGGRTVHLAAGIVLAAVAFTAYFLEL